MALTTEPFVSPLTVGDAAFVGSDPSVVSALELLRANQSASLDPLSQSIRDRTSEEITQELLQQSEFSDFEQTQPIVQQLRNNQFSPTAIAQRVTQDDTFITPPASAPKIENILQQDADLLNNDPVVALAESARREAAPSFVQVVDQHGFDEDGEPSTSDPSVSASDIMAGNEVGLEGVSRADSAPFAAAEGRGNIFSGMPTVDNPFGGDPISTANLAQTATRGFASALGRTMGPYGGLVTGPIGDLISGKSAEEAARGAISNVGKTVLGAFTSPFIAAPLFAGVETAIGVAAAEEEGITNIKGSNVLAAFFGNLTGGLIGDTMATQVTEQNVFEEEIEDMFSMFGKAPTKGWGIINYFEDDWNLKVKSEWETEKELLEEIETARTRENLKQEWQRQIEEFQKKERTAKQSGADGPGPGISGPSLGIGPISEQTFGVYGLDTGDYDGNPPSEDPGGDGSPGDGSPAGAGGGDPAGTPW